MALFKSACRKLLVLLSLTSLPAIGLELGLVKPLAGKHFTPREKLDGGHWNENYLDSLGVYVSSDNGFTFTSIYIHRNSLYTPSIYTHLSWLPTITRIYKAFVKGGLGAGIATGYPRMPLSIGPFLPYGGLELELGYDRLSTTLQVLPDKYGFIVLGLKYVLKKF